MFERFTERARKAVVLAQDEARRLRHDYVGTEHLLMGLIREEESVAAQALNATGVTLDKVREQVESIVGYGDDEPGSQAPFTPRSKKVLEMALKEAMQLGHNYIGTEHLLLGQLREYEGVAAIALSNLDVDPDAVRREVLEVVAEDQTDVSGPYLGTEPFRTRLGGIDVRARYGNNSDERAERRLLYVDLDIVHGAPGIVDADVLADSLRRALESIGFTLLESLVERVGQHVLEALPMAEQVTVTVTRDPATKTLPEVSVARAFKRW